MFYSLANINLGWRKSTLCPVPKLPLVSVLKNLKCSRLDVYGQDSQIAAVPPLACNFSKVKATPNILGLSDENGCVILFDTNKHGEQAVLKYWSAHSNAIFDLAWMENEHKLLTASGDQTIVLWDALSQQKIQTFKGHSRSVKSVCFSPSSNFVFCSGSRDGQILIYDTRVNSRDGYMRSVSTIKNAHSTGPAMHLKRNYRNKNNDNREKSVTAVLYQTDNLLASAGAINSTVKIWDLRKCSSQNQDPVPAYMFMCSKNAMRNFGITSLAFDPSLSRLFATCKDHSVYLYNSATYAREPIRTYRGYQNTSFYIKAAVSPCGRFFVSGSNDDNAYIWEVEGSEYPCITLAGHTAEVTAVAWSQHDFGKIATLSDDNTMRMWRLNCRSLPADILDTSGSAMEYIHEIAPSSPSVSGCESSQSLTPYSDSTPPFVGLKVRTTPVSSPSTLSIKDWLKKPVSDWTSVNSPENSQIEMCNLIDEEQDNHLIENSSPCSSQLEKRKNTAKRKLESSYTASTCQSPTKQRNILRTPNWENPNQQENFNRSNLVLKSPEKSSSSSKCLFPASKQIKDQLVDMENTPTNTEISFCERTRSEKDSSDSKPLTSSPGYSVFDVLRSSGHSPLHSHSSKRTPKSARSNRKPLQKGSPESRNQSILTFINRNTPHN
ncbi:homolog [Octopus vulgaris]|uniref:Homolog n=3 Tax=Octopus vulgaris TaxID=6645 RepID=A0AA36ATN9_OCTVU|nr:homolog [Octopus vulgaris]